jgi:hypothetical protein
MSSKICCISCGEALPPRVSFCPHCGKPVGIAHVAAAVASGTAPAPHAPREPHVLRADAPVSVGAADPATRGDRHVIAIACWYLATGIGVVLGLLADVTGLLKLQVGVTLPIAARFGLGLWAALYLAAGLGFRAYSSPSRFVVLVQLAFAALASMGSVPDPRDLNWPYVIGLALVVVPGWLWPLSVALFTFSAGAICFSREHRERQRFQVNTYSLRYRSPFFYLPLALGLLVILILLGIGILAASGR